MYILPLFEVKQLCDEHTRFTCGFWRVIWGVGSGSALFRTHFDWNVKAVLKMECIRNSGWYIRQGCGYICEGKTIKEEIPPQTP